MLQPFVDVLRTLLLVITANYILFTFSPLGAVAQTSSELIENNHSSAYRAAKGVVKKMYRRVDWPVWQRGDGLDLVGCGSADLRHGGGPLAEAAQSVVSVEINLKAAGYPQKLWRNRVRQYEKELLQLYTEGGDIDHSSSAYSLGDLAENLNNYRSRKNKRLPEVFLNGGCGDGEVFITIKAIPDDASTKFLTEFHYRLCRAQGLDPFDSEDCDHWEEAETEIVALAGDYRYIVEWSDGTTKKGVKRFNNRQFDGVKIIFRK